MKNIYFKNSQKMIDIKNETVDLIITSPPYFNIKDYAKNGYQDEIHSKNSANQIGNIKDYRIFFICLGILCLTHLLAVARL